MILLIEDTIMPIDKNKKDKLTDSEKKKLKQANKAKANPGKAASNKEKKQERRGKQEAEAEREKQGNEDKKARKAKEVAEQEKRNKEQLAMKELRRVQMKQQKEDAATAVTDTEEAVSS